MGLRRAVALGLAASLWLAAGVAGAQPVTDAAARADLARQLVAVIRPDAASEITTSVVVMQVTYMTTRGFAAGGPPLDEKQLAKSLQAAARATLAANHAALAQVYAQKMSAGDLQAALAFYRGADGQAALKARVRVTETILRSTEAALAGRGDAPPPAAPRYTPSAAEAAFEASPPGVAMAAADDAVAADNLQRSIEAATADYCGHAACDAVTRQFFQFMDDTVSPGRAKGEHAMVGSTARDLAPDDKAAKLARAACAGNAAGVAAAVKAGANPNATWKEGVGPGAVREMLTPLLWALDCGNLAGVKALLDAGADPNQAEAFGATPVTVAAENKNPELLKLLLSRGGDANAHDSRVTALQLALRVGADLERDKTPKARAWANWDLLLAAGADPNRAPPNGLTLIDQAAFDSRFDKVEWLLGHNWKGDPVSLGRDLEMQENLHHVPEDQMAAMQRVKAELVARGVRFPVGPLVKLSRDKNGFLVQP
jgi:hypothetical protein